jgi:hypothetical protein
LDRLVEPLLSLNSGRTVSYLVVALSPIVGYAANPLALQQIWLFIAAPLIGAGVAGLLFKSGLLAADDVVPVLGAADSDVAPGASAPVEPAALKSGVASAFSAGKDWAAHVKKYAAGADDQAIAGIGGSFAIPFAKSRYGPCPLLG